jgi:apolipoprotein N-acyltransferase
VRALAGRVRALRAPSALVVALVCGAALALGQPPVSWPLALFVAAPPLLWLVDGTEGRAAAFRLGWAAGVGFFGAGLFWIVEPFQIDAAATGWMAPFALVGMACGLALFWGMGFALARIAWPAGPARALTLAAALTLADVVRAHVFTGFPWALQAYAWIETPVAQALAVVGPYGLGLVTLALGFAPAVAFRRGGALGPAALAAACVAALWAFGAARLSAPTPERAEPVVVRLVQPNARQEDKWRPEMRAEFHRRHLAETRALADPQPDVTIWSETAVSFVLGYDPAAQAEVAAAPPRGLLILGVQRYEEPTGRWFNSLALLDRAGAPLAVYDKHHLVPFGEYIPGAGWIALLGWDELTTLTSRGFTAGQGPHLIAAPGVPPFLPLICYEAIFPDGMDAPEGRPDWLVQVTNDAWFGDLAGPQQHFAQARARAIEQGLPLARAANTGISAMVDPYGRTLAMLPLGAQGHVDARLPAPLPETIYAKHGDWPVTALVVGIFLLTVSNFNGGLSSRRWR